MHAKYMFQDFYLDGLFDWLHDQMSTINLSDSWPKPIATMKKTKCRVGMLKLFYKRFQSLSAQYVLPCRGLLFKCEKYLNILWHDLYDHPPKRISMLLAQTCEPRSLILFFFSFSFLTFHKKNVTKNQLVKKMDILYPSLFQSMAASPSCSMHLPIKVWKLQKIYHEFNITGQHPIKILVQTIISTIINSKFFGILIQKMQHSKT